MVIEHAARIDLPGHHVLSCDCGFAEFGVDRRDGCVSVGEQRDVSCFEGAGGVGDVGGQSVDQPTPAERQHVTQLCSSTAVMVLSPPVTSDHGRGDAPSADAAGDAPVTHR